MKKLLLILAMWIGFFIYACQKNEPQGYGEDQGCNCGIICDDSIDSANQCYWFIIENECSGVAKTFCVDQLVWSAYQVGERICINDESPW